MINETLMKMSEAFGPQVGMIVILPAAIIALFILYFITGTISTISTDEEYDEEYDDDESDEEPEKKAKKTAYEILSERFARGEISDEEYTEKMARL